MKARIVYWKDVKDRRMEECVENVNPSAFRAAEYAYWKVLIADENVSVERGKIALVKVRRIALPPYTVVSPLSVMRHALGTVVDVYEERPSRIEEEKEIVAAAFLPVEDGEIEEGDLVGIVKVYVVNVAPPELMTRIEAPNIRLELGSFDVNLVYRDNGEIIRRGAIVNEYWYRRWNLAEWLPLVAAEDVEVSSGDVRVIKVEPVEIPENTIPVPLSMMRHALGTVIDVAHLGRPRLVEERKIVSSAVFMPVFDGKIEKGDLIGVLNVYYISTGERLSSLMRYLTKSEKSKIVYWRDKKIVRKEIEIKPFCFRRSTIGRFEPVISAENKTVRASRVEVIRIEELEFPGGTILQPLTARNHALGAVIDVTSFTAPRMVEEDKSISHAVLLTTHKGEIRKGDLLGVLAVHHVSVLIEPELFVAKYRELFAR